jgi:glycosyltransferase involved in cell wall biosynthesis
MLAGYGHNVTVFVPDDRVKDHEVTDDGESIRVIRFGTNRTGMLNQLGHIARMSYEFAFIARDMIRQYGKPDIIESQEYLAIPYYLLQFKLLKYPEFSGVPVLLTLHSPAFLYLHYNREGEYQFPNYWTGEMEMSCICSADWVIAPSAYIIGEIEKHQGLKVLREANMSVIRNPYRFPDTPAAPSVIRNKIVFYGKLSPTKGIFELLSYMKDLWDNGFPHPLIIIGGTDKVYYPEMKTMGQVVHNRFGGYIKKGLIQFTGKIAPAKKDAYLSDAHVILIPSRVDNLPYACIEAMGLGKTVLVSRQGGQAELIEEGVNGFLFDHHVPGSFVEQLGRILALDDAALSSIGLAAGQEIQRLLQYQLVYDQKIAIIDRVVRGYKEPVVFPFTRSPYPDKKADPAQQVRGLLSVVIPYFNLGPYIRECISSLLASDYPPLEILIIDDGSTDPASIGALEQFESISAVKVFRKKNEGLAFARNHGALMARGEFLAFLDADDTVAPDYYTKAIRVLNQYDNISFMGTWVQYFGSKRGKWISWNPEPPYILMHNTMNSSS